MTNEQTELNTEEEPQTSYSKSHEHYNPVVLSDTVGALFLETISIILMVVVGSLFVHIRKLEDRLRVPGHSVE